MRAWRSHINILRALIIRDLMARYGRAHLGIAWAVLEPMILCVGVMLIWSLIHDKTIHGVPVIAFVVTGYMPLTLWRHLTGSMVRLFRMNMGLLYHRPVAHVHVAAARIITEFLSTTAALGVIYFFTLSTGLVEPVVEPGLLLAGWLFTAWFFSGWGLVIAAITEYWEPADKFIGPANYLALPISGIFFMAAWMPNSTQKLFLLNPTVSCIEMFRAGFFGRTVETHFDVWYLATCSLILMIVGIWAVHAVRDHIV
jgi:capsular polysaccharide transport system permease protein